MSYFTDANFGDIIDKTCLEFRGNRQIIALMKADIKAFSETTRRESIVWRKFYRDRAKGLTTWEQRPDWRTTDSCYMRHAFLAYGYMRFKPWEKIEPKTAAFKKSDGCSFNRMYYQGSPNQALIAAIIKFYAEKLQAVPNAA